MKQLFGNYLGLCVNNNDPEKRGRVQVFIPHLMPAMYENWNELGEDVKLVCLGDNLPDSLPPDILDKLIKILPWAESASPILGTSSPGNLITQAAGAVAGAVGAAAGAVGSYFNQSPVPEPIESGGASGIGSEGGLLNEALKYAGSDGLGQTVRGRLTTPGAKGGGACGRGTIAVVGALTNNRAFQQGSAGGNAKDYSVGRSAPSDRFAQSGIYQPRQAVGANYLNDPSQWRVGDVIASAGGANGHIQVWTGKQWVSDFQQGNRILQSSYNNFTLHRLNPNGVAAVNARSELLGGLTGGTGAAEQPQTGIENASASSGPAAVTPHQDPNPVGDPEAAPTQWGNIANPETQTTGAPVSGVPAGATSSITGINSNMSPAFKAQYERAFNALNGSRFVGTVPKDGAKYGITTGSREEWAHFMTRLASTESGFNPNVQADINGIKPGQRGYNGDSQSFGLYQMGRSQFRTYGGGGNVYNPNDNTNAFVKYAESMYFGGGSYGRGGGTNSIAGKSGGQWLGLAAAYGPLRKITTGKQNKNESQLLAGNISASERQTGNYTSPPPSAETAAEATAVANSGSMVNRTDGNGPTAVLNLNNMAKGVFTYPAAGALLWVFFREGNPLFPVYFAANYGAAEWSSAYRTSSPAPGYQPTPVDESLITSTGGMMNLNGVGGLRWEDTNSPLDRTQDTKSIMLFGHDGSNIYLRDGYNQYYSKFDRRDQVEGDRFETTLGFKEDWVQGDSNEVVMGDLFVKVGNVSPPCVNAVERIQQIIGEIMQPLAESGSGGGSGGSRSTGSSSDISKGPFPTPSEVLESQSKGLSEVASQPNVARAVAASSAAAGVNVSLAQADRYAKAANAAYNVTKRAATATVKVVNDFVSGGGSSLEERAK